MISLRTSSAIAFRFLNMLVPTDDEKDDCLISCRYGDLDGVQDFVKKFGPESLASVRDDNANSILHMVCGNGHLGERPSICISLPSYVGTPYLIFERCTTDVLDYLLPIIPTSLLAVQNNPGSTPLHWASLNSHLLIAQRLVEFPGGPGIDLIDIKNAAGRSPLAEAELAGWHEGAKWFVQMMRLDAEVVENEGDAEESTDGSNDVEVQIEDADGHMANLTISSGGAKVS